jgi:amino acid transporter/mannitol/fructose-specific phosphotransferase system IIA component (Ntr-type)
MPRAGGAYYFLDRSLGPMVGTVGGLGTWLLLILKSSFALIGMGAYLTLVMDLPIKPVAIALTVVFALLNAVGAKESSGVQRYLVLLVLGLLTVFLVQGLVALTGGGDPDVVAGGFSPFMTHGAEGLVATMGLVFVSYVGLTQVASVSEEVHDPERNIPLGMSLALLTATAIYVVGVSIMVAVVDPAVLYSSLTPVADAGARLFGWLPRPVVLALVLIPALAGFASAGNAGILAASRYPLAMGRDHLLPRQFADLGRSGTPRLAIAVTAGLMILVIWRLDVVSVAKLASAFQLMVFGLINLAVIVMRESRIESYDPGFRSPFYPWIQIVGLLAPFFLIAEMGLLPLAFTTLLVGVCLAWYFWYARDRVTREGAVFHWFERLGERRFDGLDTELRGILKEKGLRAEDPFDEVVARALVIDRPGKVTFEDVVTDASERLAANLPVTPDRLTAGFLHGARTGATPVAHGAALPHVRLPEAEAPHMVIVRSKSGLTVEVGEDFNHPAHDERVYAVFFLVSPDENPGQHLRILAQVAGRVDDDDFMLAWMACEGEQELKEVLLRDERYLSLRLHPETRSGELIGRYLRDVSMPDGCLVALVRRGRESIVPRGSTMLQADDRLTIIGEPAGIQELSDRYGA